MPLADYVANVESVAVAGTKEDAASFRLAAYADAVGRLERFRQPAARGWAADLAEARCHLATARGVGLEEQTRLADIAIARRSADARVGLASPADVARTMERVMPTPVDIESESRIAQLAAAARRQWAQQVRSGVGRPDELILARLNSGSLDGVEAFAQATRAFEASLRFRRTGTASLADVSRSYAAMEAAFRVLPDDSRAEHFDAMRLGQSRLRRLADATGDRRGRIEADVRLIRRMTRVAPSVVPEVRPVAVPNRDPNVGDARRVIDPKEDTRTATEASDSPAQDGAAVPSAPREATERPNRVQDLRQD